MFDAFKAILKRLPGAPSAAEDALTRNDPRVAATALLLHLVDADGDRQDVELRALEMLVRDAYGLDAREAETLIAAADDAVHGTVDLFSFTSVLVREVAHEDRVAFVEQMWEIAFSDRRLHELEEHVLWRIGELVGVERTRQIELRRAVQQRFGVDRTGRPLNER